MTIVAVIVCHRDVHSDECVWGVRVLLLLLLLLLTLVHEST